MNAYLEDEDHKEENAPTRSPKDIKHQHTENDEEEYDFYILVYLASASDFFYYIRENEEETRFMTEEERNVGNIKFGVYKSYFNLLGRLNFIVVILCVLLVQTSYIIKDWWLGVWSSKEIEYVI